MGKQCVALWSPRDGRRARDLPPTRAPADKAAFGFRMLAKMGWSEGKGLGKHEDGAATHIRLKRRPDALGVGAGADTAGNVSLLGAVQDYNRILASLGATGAGEGEGAAATAPSRRRRASSAGSDSDEAAAVAAPAPPPPATTGKIVGRIP